MSNGKYFLCVAYSNNLCGSHFTHFQVNLDLIFEFWIFFPLNVDSKDLLDNLKVLPLCVSCSFSFT